MDRTSPAVAPGDGEPMALEGNLLCADSRDAHKGVDDRNKRTSARSGCGASCSLGPQGEGNDMKPAIVAFAAR